MITDNAITALIDVKRHLETEIEQQTAMLAGLRKKHTAIDAAIRVMHGGDIPEAMNVPSLSAGESKPPVRMEKLAAGVAEVLGSMPRKNGIFSLNVFSLNAVLSDLVALGTITQAHADDTSYRVKIAKLVADAPGVARITPSRKWPIEFRWE